MSLLLSLALLGLAGHSVGQGIPDRGFPDCQDGPLKNNTVCDTTADPLERARALISLFTVEEKLNNTGSVSPGVPRLGVPPYQWWQEALHGVASSPGVNFSTNGDFSYATSFPQPILMGAAFDDELIREVASIVSTEARAFNNDGRAGLDFWTPNINPFRDPRWGRGQETPGEDPFHISSYVHALIDGLQGGYDPKYKKIVATCKHFAGYDMESWNGNYRYQWDAHISQQDLKDYYTPGFQSCARDSNVGAIMCTYNALNGVPTCADPWLLGDLLRDHWGWTNEQQWVTSDCDSLQNIYLPHEFASTRPEAAAKALLAGTDLDCGTYYQHHLPKAYAQGLFNESVLDQALIRQYSSLIRLGYFDGDAVPYRSLGWSDVNTGNAQQLAYKAAVEGITLLKNDGLLPLQVSSNMSIAVIGGWGNATEQMQGNYYGVAPYLHSPYYAAQQLGATVYLHTVPGGQGDPTTNSWLTVWGDVEKSDLIIYADGIDNSVELEGMDRNSVAWTGAQLDMIGELASYGKPMVVLQMGGGQIDSAPIANNENISALIWGGYPGQDGGVALLDIITGKAAPAGRLPLTQYPAEYIAQVPMTDMSIRPDESTGSPGRTYQWYTGTPTYEFGHGLHYTNFSASFSSGSSPSSYGSSSGSSSHSIQDLVGNCHEHYQDKCLFRTFDVDIQNTGSIASDYSALAFLTGTHGPKPYPNKRLVAYRRLHDLTAGSTSTAHLNLTLGSLSRADNKGNSVLYPGDYALLIDTQPLAMLNFTLTGQEAIIDLWPQPPEPTYQTSDYFVGGYGSTYGEDVLINGTV
ncbi:glycoside hydrolase family 3 protein [Polychaeton citri CBS 116435]|uniref:xylan 1,4-beta-xylosidase n=1 Tax=Polychaeton citri CBS 116435 TaxID=1314669 RepID=A0A9P4Q6Z8_9PEZI|nr:glycoside hydrolase family 3 protein [Polychaeton citri CBS 116435]